ncbi:MAG: hypothetical protein IH596_10905 [Bacteroidales bacterium]|nr:hypothetical protein [Bacteroidales bacterium]
MKNQHFVPAINNYCDRWCSKCSKATQCQLFAKKQTQQLNGIKMDFQNEGFWKRLIENLSSATVELEKALAEFKTDPNNDTSVTHSPFYEKQLELLDQSSLYGMEVNRWLTEIQDYLSDFFRFSEDNGNVSIITINDACEVLRWYSMLISVKISQASFQHKWEGKETIKYDEQIGSAKVALIGLESSMAAFLKILTGFPQYEDQILVFLAKLAIIKQEVNRLFPEAESFKRPGFDS